MKSHLILTFLLAVFVSNVSAQCATGVDTGGGACIPPDAAGMPGNNDQNIRQKPEIQPILEDRWGAIVFGVDKPVEGSVTEFSTKKDAIKAATAACRSKGAEICELQLAYYNQCIAVAWGNKGHSINSAAGEIDARSRALKGCSSVTDGCKVVHTACSYPERVN